MDKKYIYKTLPLPRAIGAALEKKRTELSAIVGFELSLSQAVGYLVRFHSDRNKEYEDTNGRDETPDRPV